MSRIKQISHGLCLCAIASRYYDEAMIFHIVFYLVEAAWIMLVAKEGRLPLRHVQLIVHHILTIELVSELLALQYYRLETLLPIASHCLLVALSSRLVPFILYIASYFVAFTIVAWNGWQLPGNVTFAVTLGLHIVNLCVALILKCRVTQAKLRR
jgi:hypothetical protein